MTGGSSKVLEWDRIKDPVWNAMERNKNGRRRDCPFENNFEDFLFFRFFPRSESMTIYWNEPNALF